MDHFQYVDGRMHAEDVPLDAIAEAVGTPFYCYSTATLTRHFRVFADAFEGLDTLVCFAVKANSNLAVIRTLAAQGAGADVVSGGELRRALAAGVPAEKIVFSGVGKTDAELTAALRAGVMQINVESEPELERLSAVASDMGVTAAVAIRVNPDVDAKTHEKITTGRKENKFGIEWTRARTVYEKAARLPGIKPVSVAVHIGSQLTELQPFRDAYVRLRDLVAVLRKDGHAIERVDLGGGLGIPYGSDDDEGDPLDDPMPGPLDYARVVREVWDGFDGTLVFEPGRLIAGNAGILVTRTTYVKEGSTRTFAIVDAAMNDLARPSLYGAFHAIEPVRQPAAGTEPTPIDVVGPVCETGDTFGTGRPLPPLEAGDLLILRSAGAYGAVMASMYNSRDLIAEVLVSGKEFAVIRKRITVDDVMARETVPDWIAEGGGS
jgi:diaminopimelate decarboxylase